MFVVVIVAASVLAAVRLYGAKSQSFQAAAHLFVGGLLGAILIVGVPAGCGYLTIATALSVVELFAFGRALIRSKQTH